MAKAYQVSLQAGALLEQLLNPAELSALTDTTAPLAILPPSNATPPDVTNFRCNGFESAVFTVNGVSAKLKVRSPANVVLWLCHGDSLSGDLSLTRDSIDGIPNVTPPVPPVLPGAPRILIAPNLSGVGDNPNLETVIMVACGALCFRDYNNNFNLANPSTPTINRTYGGLNWLSAAGLQSAQNRRVLLGYNAPTGRELAVDVLREYGNQMELLRTKVAPEVLQQYAWIKANIVVAQAGNKDFFNCWNACALDRDNYYYIPRAPLEAAPRNTQSPVVNRIPAAAWSTDPKDWTAIEKSYRRRVTIP